MADYHPRNTVRARELRRDTTPAERRLWTQLARRQLGVKISRQMPIGPYFADFLCREFRLVIELDGYSHELRPAHDAARDAWMVAQGYRVVRFANAQVFDAIESVVLAIRMEIEALSKGAASCPPRCD